MRTWLISILFNLIAIVRFFYGVRLFHGSSSQIRPSPIPQPNAREWLVVGLTLRHRKFPGAWLHQQGWFEQIWVDNFLMLKAVWFTPTPLLAPEFVGPDENGSQTLECRRFHSHMLCQAPRGKWRHQYLSLIPKHQSKLNPKWNDYFFQKDSN
jgi:hypothetical protein